MPKIKIWSDLHLEFRDSHPQWKNKSADVLILAGDICVAEHLYRNPGAGLDGLIQNGWYAKDAMRYRRFFDHVSKEFPVVLYVMGNHEHYSGRWDRTEDILRNEFSRYENIHLLEQGKKVIDDVVFLGSSLWTDLNGYDPITEFSVKDMMNDYKHITQKSGEAYHKLSPRTTAMKHRETAEWIDMMLTEDKRKTVVIGHHAPSRQSIHPKYAHDTIMNGAFCSNLDWMMMDRDNIPLWIHGHVHDRHDYMINNTRVICNPRGYPGETAELDFDPDWVITV